MRGMSNRMFEIKKLKDFMKERGIQEGEQFAMLPLKLKFEDILEKYHFEDGEIIEND